MPTHSYWSIKKICATGPLIRFCFVVQAAAVFAARAFS